MELGYSTLHYILCTWMASIVCFLLIRCGKNKMAKSHQKPRPYRPNELSAHGLSMLGRPVVTISHQHSSATVLVAAATAVATACILFVVVVDGSSDKALKLSNCLMVIRRRVVECARRPNYCDHTFIYLLNFMNATIQFLVHH